MTTTNDALVGRELEGKVADAIQVAAVEASGVEDVWQFPSGWDVTVELAAKEIIDLVRQHGKGYVTFRLKDEQMEAINRSVEEYAQEFRDGIRAARDAEIREALLSEEAVIEAVESIRTSPVLDRSSYHSLPPEGPGAGEPGKWLGHELRREWREYVGRPAIEAALDHIGLHGDGTGGQG